MPATGATRQNPVASIAAGQESQTDLDTFCRRRDDLIKFWGRYRKVDFYNTILAAEIGMNRDGKRHAQYTDRY